MSSALILALLQAVPSLFADAEAIVADLNSPDQASIAAALQVAKAAAITEVNKTIEDLG